MTPARLVGIGALACAVVLVLALAFGVLPVVALVGGPLLVLVLVVALVVAYFEGPHDRR